MNIIKLNDLKENQISDVLSAKVVLSDENIEIIRATLKPLAEIPLHVNNIDVVLQIIEGVGELTIEQNKYILEKNMFIKVPKDLNRAWKNLNDNNFIFQAIKYK